MSEAPGTRPLSSAWPVTLPPLKLTICATPSSVTRTGEA